MEKNFEVSDVDFAKSDLVPAIVQDYSTGTVLMLGYMNKEALEKTLAEGKVTFFSRSKGRLWTKGEESGNFLNGVSIKLDCDKDTILVRANPVGPVCHTGTDTCWHEENKPEGNLEVFKYLEDTIRNRKENENDTSYVSSLFKKGINKVAQKVGEEAVEVVIEAKDDNDDLFLEESADLLFHYLILLQAKGYQLDDVLSVLKGRVK